MKTQLLSQFPYPWLSVLGMLIFLSTFVGIFYFAYRRSSQEAWGQASHIPFQEMDSSEEREASR